MSALRAMAAQMSDAALEALTSRGLARRALADAAAGKVELRREEDGAAELAVDGETVRLTADGIAKSSCTCPAPGICRHRLAAIVHLRSAAPIDTPSIDWRSVFEAMTPTAIARFAGKAGWQKVLSRDETSASVEDRGSSFVVQSAEHSVVFLPEGGLLAAISKAPASARKIVIAAAALAARRAFDLPLPDRDEVAPPAAATREKDTAGLAEIRRFLERAWTSAFVLVPVALEDEARRLALSSRAEAAPRLASLLRRTASGIAALRLRNADADPDELLRLLAETYALCIALENEPAEPLQSGLRGVVRQEYADIGDAELFGLGARLWETPSGAHGVTAHFFAPADGKTYSLTFARADKTDVQFDSRTAFRQTGIWGDKMSALCVAMIRLQNAQASAGGRLSTSGNTRAQIEPWSPTPDTVRQWSCAFEDWGHLQTYLQARFTPRLAADSNRDVPVLLLFSRQASARFDEITQTLSWPVADVSGRWIGLTLDYEGVERDRISVLEEMIRTERFWGVVVNAVREDDRITLRPYALWGATQHLLDFTAKRPSKESNFLIDLLRRFRTGRSSGPHSFVTETPATDAVLARSWNNLLRRAEGGIAPAESIRISDELESAGFSALARLYRYSADKPEADAALRAAYAVVTMRLARASVAWMQ